jgi:hypothetical protein
VNYRNTVLTAFQEVEDNLAALHRLEEESVSEAAAVTATGRAMAAVIHDALRAARLADAGRRSGYRANGGYGAPNGCTGAGRHRLAFNRETAGVQSL